MVPQASEEFIKFKLQMILDSRHALDDFFSITVEETEDGDIFITGSPVMLPLLSTPWSEVALAVISLPQPFPNNDEENIVWIKSFATKLAAAFAAPLFRYTKTGKELSTLQYWNDQVLSCIKPIYICGPQFTNNLVTGTNTDLYKSFDRC